jgi:hypothetical protein
MASLRENKPLLISIVVSLCTIAALATGLMPDLAAQCEIIEFPPEVKRCMETSTVNSFNMCFHAVPDDSDSGIVSGLCAHVGD